MNESEQPAARAYARFGAMIVTSGVLMYAVMYLHTYVIGHVRWSETRVFMTLLMVSVMTLVMLGYMLHMYRNRGANSAIVIASVSAFGIALWLLRSQASVDDVDYMEGMIPHHSIAILTSERARVDDVRVRELADQIIESQRREIEAMKWLIDDIDAHGPATTDQQAARRPVPHFDASP